MILIYNGHADSPYQVFLHNRVLAWDRNSFLTHVILPRQSQERSVHCIGTHAHGRQEMSFLCQSDAYFLELEAKFNGVQEK